MKIGISVTPLYHINGEHKLIDGIGAYTSHLCKELISQNVHLAPIYFKQIGETASTTSEHFLIANNPLYSLFPGNYYHSVENKIDLLHITDYLTPRIKNIPTISTIHDGVMLKHPEWLGGSKYLRYLKGAILKKLAKQVDFVITCSQANVGDIVNFWKIPAEKIAVIYWGLADSWRQKIDPDVQQTVLKKYQLTKPFFLSVGTLQPRKNTDRIINAYSHLPKHIREQFQLVLVGKNHPSLTPPSLLEKINQLQQSGQLSWLRYVPFEDLVSLYQSAYLLLFPSLEEGFGFPVLEGFASETAVITSHYGATAEIAGTAAYLVDPYSDQAISAAMIELTEKPDLRRNLIQQGLLRVKSFTWQRCAQQTISIYNKLLNN